MQSYKGSLHRILHRGRLFIRSGSCACIYFVDFVKEERESRGEGHSQSYMCYIFIYFFRFIFWPSSPSLWGINFHIV